MKVSGALAALLVHAAMTGAAAQVDPPRELSDGETRVAIETLLKEPANGLSDDPSCKTDLNAPGGMSIAQGLAVALVRAATDRIPVNIRAECFVRRGYPLSDGEEYCRLAVRDPARPRGAGYGLVFVMNWKAMRVRPRSVECY